MWFALFALIAACSADGRATKPDTRADIIRRAVAAECNAQHWIGAWRAAPSGAGRSFENQTLRLVIAPHLEGRTLRVRLSNRFGSNALPISEVSIGVRGTGAGLRAGTSKPVTFHGQRGVTISKGARAISDPVALNIARSDDVAVTLYVRRPTGPATEHLVASETAMYLASGGHVDDASGAAFSTSMKTWYLLEGLDVRVPAGVGAIAAFGDSITDGYASTTAQRSGEHNTRYPDFLAQRLQGAKRRLAVANLGVSNNLVLADSREGGQSGLARLDHDILGTPGVTDVLLLEGINDIGRGNATARAGDRRPGSDRRSAAGRGPSRHGRHAAPDRRARASRPTAIRRPLAPAAT